MSIKIDLNDKWVLTSDDKQFILNRRSWAQEDKYDKEGKLIVRAGDEQLSPCAFWGDVRSLLAALPSRVVMSTSDANTLEQLANDYRRVMAEILKQVSR